MPRIKKKPKKTTVWGGPEEAGITQSLLSRFLCCRERFRLLVVEGLKPKDAFNHHLEYGNLWHEAEEHFAAGRDNWLTHVQSYGKELIHRYRNDQVAIEKWYNVCRVQFPVYIDYWKKHPDVKKRTPIFQEEVFCVPYTLPSGRVVKLKGKWDSVDWVGTKKSGGIYLQENKTKSDIDERLVVRQLGFDLQTMIYLIALKESWGDTKGKILGVRYNVVRRPLSGGKGSIRQHQPTKKNPKGETSEEYYNRLQAIIKEEPEHFFMRWKVEVLDSDIEKFKTEFLDPCLEQLCDWWDWVSSCYRINRNPFEDKCHFRNPYGIYNAQLLGRESELDEYLATGSTLGLEKTTNLFPEL